MKSFIIKIFFLVCSVVFFLEGLLLLLIYLGNIPPDEVESFIGSALQAKDTMEIILYLSIGGLIIGTICMLQVFKGTGKDQTIAIRDKDGTVHIPMATIKNLVDQILGSSHSLSGFKTIVQKKGKFIYIDISSKFKSSVSIRQEASQIKEHIKNEMEEIFDYPYFKIDFQVKRITHDMTSSRSASSGPDRINTEELERLPAETIDRDGGPEAGREEIASEENPPLKKAWKLPWKP